MAKTINSSKMEILVRFSKYGKWESINDHVEFQDKTQLISHILAKHPDEDFIAMRLEGTEATIKRN